MWYNYWTVGQWSNCMYPSFVNKPVSMACPNFDTVPDSHVWVSVGHARLATEGKEALRRKNTECCQISVSTSCQWGVLRSRVADARFNAGWTSVYTIKCQWRRVCSSNRVLANSGACLLKHGVSIGKPHKKIYMTVVIWSGATLKRFSVKNHHIILLLIHRSLPRQVWQR